MMQRSIIIFPAISLAQTDADASKNTAFIGGSQGKALEPFLAKLIPDLMVEARRNSKAKDWIGNAGLGTGTNAFEPDILIVVLGESEEPETMGTERLTTDFQQLVDRFTSDRDDPKIIWIAPIIPDKTKQAKLLDSIQRVPGIIALDFGDKDYPLGKNGQLSPNAYALWAADIARAIGL
jgi:hypothetical protein